MANGSPSKPINAPAGTQVATKARNTETKTPIITPIDPNEDRLQAHNRAVDFAEQIIPLLPAYVPN